MTELMVASRLPLPLFRKGKVREVYEVDAETLLLVASDRVSAFDVVMREPVPHKGAVLTQISAFWFERLKGISAHHCITADADEIINRVPALGEHRGTLVGRAMLCRRTTPVGHDENVTFETVVRGVGRAMAERLRTASLELYEAGRAHAAGQGIIIADTKFEFGTTADGSLLVIDEILTPDSSRFWPADRYTPGRAQPSFDKQPLRDYLAGIRKQGGWNGEPPPPALPDDVVQATSERYRDAFRQITGYALPGA